VNGRAVRRQNLWRLSFRGFRRALVALAQELMQGEGDSSGCVAHQTTMRSNLTESSAMALISISSVSRSPSLA